MLEVAGVAASHGEFVALRDVSLTVGADEVVALLGSNGAGKTTLLKTIVELLPPRAGTIRWNGEPLTRLPPDQIVERGLVLVPEGRRLFGSLTVLENLDLGAFAPRGRAARSESLERVYALFPILRERRGTLVGALSGGQPRGSGRAPVGARAPYLKRSSAPSVSGKTQAWPETEGRDHRRCAPPDDREGRPMSGRGSITKPSRFGMRICGSVRASITSCSPMIPFR